MRSLPNKLYTFRKSVLYHMLVIMRNVPDDGISRVRLYEQIRDFMSVTDFITALTYLYAIQRLELRDNHIYYA